MWRALRPNSRGTNRASYQYYGDDHTEVRDGKARRQRAGRDYYSVLREWSRNILNENCPYCVKSDEVIFFNLRESKNSQIVRYGSNQSSNTRLDYIVLTRSTILKSQMEQKAKSNAVT